MDERTERWLRLLHAPGVGHGRRRRLFELLGDIEAITHAPARELRRAGLSGAAAAVVRGDDRPAGIDHDLAWAAQAADRHLLTPDHPAWPPRLAALHDPPPVLYVRGDPEVLSLPALAIVGSRTPTGAGADTAHEFARHLAAAGLTIVSGLALGIDAAAHEGALAAGGLTVAIAGTGLDRVYPARHADLARRITAEGALAAELPIGTRVTREAFPQRNRIVTGLSLGTLVVEAAVQSGSLISARHALEQGTDVFAIPGSIHNPLARGCHRLIRQGAKLVETADDVLEELGPLIAAAPAWASGASGGEPEIAASGSADAETTAKNPDPDTERILATLDWEPRAVDDIAARSGLAPSVVASVLLRLELDGRIRAVAGGFYQRR